MSGETAVIAPKGMAKKAEKIYERLRDQLEAEHRGQVVAIDIETGDYFLGETVIAAARKGREQYPGRLFHSSTTT